MIQDTHHPTFCGYVTLAGAVLRELVRRRTFDGCQRSSYRSTARNVPASSALGPRHGQPCVSGPANTTAAWLVIVTTRWIAWINRWRYAEAARKIRAGTPIEDLGLRGIAMKSSGSPRQKSQIEQFGAQRKP